MATQDECAAFLGISRRTFIDRVTRGIYPKAAAGEYDFADITKTEVARLHRLAARNGTQALEDQLEAARESERFLETATARERKAEAREWATAKGRDRTRALPRVQRGWLHAPRGHLSSGGGGTIPTPASRQIHSPPGPHGRTAPRPPETGPSTAR
jgi:hypothetical protein